MLGRRLPAADCGLRAISAETETAFDLGEEAAAGVELGRAGGHSHMTSALREKGVSW